VAEVAIAGKHGGVIDDRVRRDVDVGRANRSPQPAVRTEDLWKTYGQGETAVHALSGVSLDIARGRLTAGDRLQTHIVARVPPRTAMTPNHSNAAKGRAHVELDESELLILSNALNEVCHGLAIDHVEFPARIGATRDEARALLTRVRAIYDRMAGAGAALLDRHGRPCAAAVAALARESAGQDRAENAGRLAAVDTAYRRLGGRYAAVADLLAARRARLLDEAQRDIEDFALLAESWRSLVRAARATEVGPAPATGPGPRW
jgi:hypothetical protein